MAFEILILCIWFAFVPIQQKLLNVTIQKGFITPFVARKIAHLAVGLWVVPLAAFVHRWYRCYPGNDDPGSQSSCELAAGKPRPS